MNIYWESPNSEDGVELVGGRPVARKVPSHQEGAEQLGGCCMIRNTPSSEEGAKQPDGCQMIGKAQTQHKAQAASSALGNLTFGDTM